IIKIPLLENQYLMYGTAIHAALDHYFNRKLNNEIPTLEQLLSDYKSAFKNIGFITREQEEQRFNQGISTLARFFSDDQKTPTIPAAVEIPFEFAENKVKIIGRYDLVCGKGERAEIKDFKTSDVKEQKDANDRIKKSTQMMIYALAWYEKYNIIPKTTLSFLESGLTGSLIFKEKDLEKTKEMIFEVADGIRSGNMTAKPESFQCKMCPYKDICDESCS
ncbi:MAG: PD-(D/E)XK nuclease family protein, partial [Candidatus Berkelbacteria bacterium]|nr:PD-(D/E)XK nuclease family protein [Candidatus Berkelbacteria bacterium]